METFLVIMRNAVIMLLSIIAFAGFYVALTKFLVRNTAEEYPEEH